MSLHQFNAITAAIDFIEANPKKYHYFDVTAPQCDSDCGCLISWIGYFAGFIPDTPTETLIPEIVEWLGYEDQTQVYDHLHNQYRAHPDSFEYDPTHVLAQWRRWSLELADA